MARAKSETRRGDSARLTVANSILVSRWRRFGLWMLCVKVALVPLLFDPSSDMPFVVPKALFSHGLAYVLAGTIVGLLLRFRGGFFVRSLLHVPVLVYALASGLAAVFAVNLGLALYGTHARMLGVGSTLDCVVLYFAVVLLVRTRVDAYAVAFSVFAPALLVLGYEVVQLMGKDPFRWNIDSAARPFSTLGQATALAQYLTVLAVGGFALGLLTDRVRLVFRTILVLCSGLLLVGAAATGTRSALLGLGAASALLVLLVWRFHPSRQTRRLSLLIAFAGTLFVAALLFFSPLGSRLVSTIENPPEGDDEVLARIEPSAAGRVPLYEIAIAMVSERPALGFGPDNYVVGVPKYRPERAPELIRQDLATSAHSWVFQVATSSGLFGLACFISIAVVAFGLALRGGFSPAAMAGAITLGAFLGTGLTTVNEFGTEWLFWTSAGAIAVATASSRSVIEPTKLSRHPTYRRERRSPHHMDFATAFLVCLGLIAALTGVRALDASRSANASRVARLDGRRPLAIESGLHAAQADPGRAEYWHILGLAYVAALRWPDAISALDRASALAPYDVGYIGDLSRAELVVASGGDQAARARALELGALATQVDPNNPRAHLTQAVVMEVLGDLPQALRSAERALALDPKSTNADLYVTAAKLLLAAGRATDAIAVARQGLGLVGSVDLRIELARALLSSGDPDHALMEIEIVLENRPNDPAAEQLRNQIRATLR